MPDPRRLLPPPGAPRVLAISTAVNTLGNGLFYTTSALYLTRSVGLSAQQVGIGLTLAGVVGLLGNVPAGHLAERRGPREVLIGILLAQAAALTAYAFVRSFAAFVVVACVEVVTNNASSAVRNGLVATSVPPADRVRTRAYLRAVTNAGIGLGSAFAGVALHVDTRAAYMTLLIADAATFLVAAVVTARLPHVPPVETAPGESRIVALRDRPFVAVTALNAVLCMHNGMMEIAVPLWVATRTSAPRWIVAVVFLVNTVMCVLLQVRATRGIDDVPSSARALRRAGVLLLAACVIFATSSGRSTTVAVVLLLVAAVVHVCGELLQSAGSWGYGFNLAPERWQGQYQGLFSMSYGVSGMLAPVIVTTLVIGWGRPGWLVLGVLYAVLGFALTPVGRWAQRAGAVAHQAHTEAHAQPVA